jgi:hypothetical protein
MRAVLTIARQDGTFPEVGTEGRVVTPETTARGVRQRARRLAKSWGRPVRVEEFARSLYQPVDRTWLCPF